MTIHFIHFVTSSPTTNEVCCLSIGLFYCNQKGGAKKLLWMKLAEETGNKKFYYVCPH